MLLFLLLNLIVILLLKRANPADLFTVAPAPMNTPIHFGQHSGTPEKCQISNQNHVPICPGARNMGMTAGATAS